MKGDSKQTWKLKGPVLVTGATGFIGSHVVHELVTQGVDVHVFVRKTSSLSRLSDVRKKITIYKGDLSDKTSVEKVVKRVKPKGIFHFGVASVVSGLGVDAKSMIATNFLGTVNLINAVAPLKYDFFVMTGSFLEYGFKKHPIREEEVCNPNEIYGITKLASTLYGSAHALSEQKPIVVCRLFTPYGPYNDPARLTHRIIERALNNKDIQLTNPQVSRDFVYIDDIVELLLEVASHASKHAGQIFNVGSGVRTKLEDVVSYIVKTMSSKSVAKWGAFRAVSYDSDAWQADMKKTYSHFSWRPKTSLKMGIDKTIAHFRDKGV